MERRTSQTLDVEIGLEAVDLAAEGVAVDADVHEAEPRLVRALNVPGQHDHAGAGAPDGLALLGHGLHRLIQLVGGHQLADGRALATGDHQPVETVQLLRKAYLDGLRSEAAQALDVLGEGALQGKYADAGQALFVMTNGVRHPSSGLRIPRFARNDKEPGLPTPSG